MSFSNQELKDKPSLKKGDLVRCKNCDGEHEVKCGKDKETGEETDLLMFYTCGDTSYLAGVSGKKVC
jgi:hypothetical protein